MEERIKRINELARKKKEEGLNEEEVLEQKELHAWYLVKVKGNLINQLDALGFTRKSSDN